MQFPAAKLGDTIMGLDFHTTTQTIVPPVPCPFFPHPFVGSIMLWHSPDWPMANVFVSGIPVATVGAKSISAHIPLPPPAVPTPPPQITMKWYLTNLATVALSSVFSLILSLIGSATGTAVPTARCPDSELPQSVTNKSAWQTITSGLGMSSWLQIFQKLLPPVVFPIAEANCSIGSPTVTVNGAPMAMVGPLFACSCTQPPTSLAPNAAVMGFSTVMVGLTFTELITQLFWNSANAAASWGASAAVNRAVEGRSH
jgi:uncharacterized Zn-binding protein involved in type VI secretion